MARAMWKAQLEIGEVRVPVKLYAAVEDRGVHFRLLHATDEVPVKQIMVDPRNGDEVSSEEVRRGIEVEEGVFVVLEPDELASLEPEASRTIEVTRFVPYDAIDLSWYRRPYMLGPDGSDGDYFALAAALRERGRRGIARWVMRGNRYFGALEAKGEHLALVALHAAEEVVAAHQLAHPGGPAISTAERKLGEQLVATLDAPFEPEEMHDDYRERVLALIEAKAEGRELPVAEEPARPAPAPDLGEALKQSLQLAKERRRAS